MFKQRIFRLLPLPIAWAIATMSAAAEAPTSSDPTLIIERFAGSDLIKHPTGIAFTHGDKLLAVESHTHFRPPNYEGPESDQIVWLEDSDSDGSADRRTVFYADELTATMDIAVHPDSGAIYVATRNEILRLWDRDDDGIADADSIERRLVYLDTEGVYPHNGISGLTVDPAGKLYFGLGENLGTAYTLTGSDGKSISDAGEGGNVFHVDSEGGQLRRYATGFWNPFGMVCTPQGHLFATDNDPSSRPPSRLHYIIEGGDYGYQFRYGRSGQHPFIAWNGELPGTLPMLHASGEAPCDVIEVDGTLLVASWADHRVEAYPLTWDRTHFTTERQVLIQGGVNFRPVAFARDSKGDLYLSDWVLRDYELHGEGAVWRISNWQPEPRTLPDAAGPDGGLLDSDDPWTFSRWLEKAEAPSPPAADHDITARELIHHRHSDSSDPHDIAGRALGSDDATVRLLALKWIADLRLEKYRAEVEAIARTPLTPIDFHAAVTAAARLDDQPVDDAAIRRLVAARLLDDDASPSLRRAAFHILPDREKLLSVRDLRTLFAQAGDNESLRIDVLLSLRLHFDLVAAQRFAAEVAEDESMSARMRAFARFASGDASALASPNADGDEIAERPSTDQIDAWLERIEATRTVTAEQSTHDTGRMLFHRHCSVCHRAEGLGRNGGPDLSQIGVRGRENLLRSIIDPGAEVAPQFEPWQLTLADGSSYLGFLAGQKGPNHFYTDISGAERTINNRDIVTREQLPFSVMPTGLQNLMSDAQLGMLLDYLESLR